jgi:hypothetical protein
MLIVIQYINDMSGSGERTDSGFFKRFVDFYPVDKQWTIGNGESPFAFETNNAAQRVQQKQKGEIIELAKQACANIQQPEGVLPWSKQHG